MWASNEHNQMGMQQHGPWRCQTAEDNDVLHNGSCFTLTVMGLNTQHSVVYIKWYCNNQHSVSLSKSTSTLKAIQSYSAADVSSQWYELPCKLHRLLKLPTPCQLDPSSCGLVHVCKTCSTNELLLQRPTITTDTHLIMKSALLFFQRSIIPLPHKCTLKSGVDL